MTNLGKIEGPAVMFADGNVCGYVNCSIVVSRNRGLVSGYGRVDAEGSELIAASEAKEVKLSLVGGDSFKIEFHRVHAAEGYASVTTSGPITGF
jgi:hypothetical protein